MKVKSLLMTLAVTAALAGCSTVDEKAEKIPLDNDPRIGEKVSQVCFTRNIDGWNSVDNDRNAVIISMSSREKYKLKLVGACDPDLAMMRAAFITRPGSSCLSRGDKVKTDGDLGRGRGSACTIMAINKWDPEAAAAEKADEKTDPGEGSGEGSGEAKEGK